MVKPSNIAAIANGTARGWEEWLAFLDSIGAEGMSHKEIARHVQETGDASGWWAQNITVAYEQHIGRRVPGQDSDGNFSVSVTKTVPGGMDAAFDRWLALVDGRSEFAGIAIARPPETSRSDKWRYWRCGLGDGSRVIVSVNQKAPGKAGLAIAVEKLESEAQIEHWRAFWKEFLSAF